MDLLGELGEVPVLEVHPAPRIRAQEPLRVQPLHPGQGRAVSHVQLGQLVMIIT